MSKVGSKVKVHTGHGGWLPGMVSTEPNDEGKQWVGVGVPPDQRDDANLQADFVMLLSGPGTGTYEHEPL